MKKFFKILRKIIKILLKTILRLILGIIVITGITTVIINNRTLKFYENDDGNMRFTMKESFIVENGTEIKLSLNEGIFMGRDINNGEINSEGIIKLKNGIIFFNLIENGYLKQNDNLKLNLPSISFIKNLYKQGYIKNFGEILPYCFDMNHISYYDNGQISVEGQQMNGKSYNLNVNEFYENGQIKTETIEFFNDGIHYAFLTGYLEDGNIEYNGYVKGLNSVGNNTWTGYFKDGTINYINHYNGYNIYYYENGNILYEGYKKNGNFDGIATGYYLDGNILVISNYENGNSYYSIYYNKDGTILGTGNFINGKYIKSHIVMHYNGQILFIENSEGLGTGYYENGNIAFIGNYSSGNLIIHGTEYSNEGFILTTYNYDGNGNGYRVYYDENGDILGTGEDIDNKTVNGLYIDYSSNDGQILEKGNYIDGNKDGYRVEYFDDGQIYSEGNYDNGKRVGLWNRYLGDGSIGVSNDYGGIEEIDDK